MIKFIVTLNLILVFSFLGISGKGQQTSAQKLRNEVRRANGTLQFLTFETGKELHWNEIESWIQLEVYSAHPTIQFKKAKEELDKNGYKHMTYKQFYHQLPVEFGVIKFHGKNNLVLNLNAEYYLPERLPKPSSISLPDAERKVLSKMKEIDSLSESVKISFWESLYYPLPDGNLELCYKFDAKANENHFFIYISQSTNQVIAALSQHVDINAVGTVHTKRYGPKNVITDSLAPNNFTLRQTGNRNIEVKNANSSTNVWTNATPFTNSTNTWNVDSIAHDAYYGLEKSWDYYQIEHGRNSYDGLNSLMTAYVHYDLNLTNAFGSPGMISIGDGDGITSTALTTTEIVGHEYTHAVIATSAGLIYANESGALNESFADIFGVAIDHYANNATANFLMGDQIYNDGRLFRNMAHPNSTQHPDTYLGANWYIGVWDYGGVHTNSQVQNFWFYLLCHGGNGVNDQGDTFAVSAIGMNDASDIAFRTLTVYLTSNSNYQEARFYSIQSAVDLFGPCSNQVREVTNAWHAVGVGNPYLNGVYAGFIANDTVLCNTPSSVIFNNTSNNANTFYWNFGDGGTSTSMMPAHTYNNTGNYTVQLVVTGSQGCNLVDTFKMNQYIHVYQGNNVIPPSCIPYTTGGCCGNGILNFQLGTINRSSGGAPDNYEDLSCTMSTTLVAGSTYPISINNGYNNYAKVFIDYNNDGSFGANELCWQANGGFQQSGYINTQFTTVLNTPLRLRVVASAYPINNACNNLANGQAEDYSVIFTANSLAPIASFMLADTNIALGASVNFQDLSINAPSSWQWTIGGGTPLNATSQNPSSVFNTLGTYQVKLKVTNSFGSDSITKTIHVINTYTMCNSISTTVANGFLYDSGGSSGAYNNNEYCGFLIQPTLNCIDSITFTITSLDVEMGIDQLGIYDGTNTNGPVLFSSLSSTTLPITVTAHSGKIYVLFYSNNANTFSGFAGNWTTHQSPITPPIANFTMSTANPPVLDTVFFADNDTSNTTQWLWNFGDGNTSSAQHPTHLYTNPGTYAVTLIATSCLASDTFTQTVIVQSSPQVNYSSLVQSINLGCNDTGYVNFSIVNTGGGSLFYNISQINSAVENQLLVWMYNTDTTLLYPQMISALNQYYSNHTISICNSNLSTVLQANLIGKKVLIIPHNVLGDYSAYVACTPIIQDFMQNGGTVITLGSNLSLSNLNLVNFGLGWMNTYSPFALNVPNPNTKITEGLPNSFSSVSNTYFYDVNNAGHIGLVESNNLYFAGYVPFGGGKAIYLGFDYYQYNAYTAMLLANAVKWGMESILGNHVFPNPVGGNILPGSSNNVTLQVVSNGLPGGIHTFPVLVKSNDLSNVYDTLLIHVNVANTPCVAYTYSQQNLCSKTFQFTDNTTNSPTTWLWNFGDGNFSTQQNPNHTYTTGGNYAVKLIATNSFGQDSMEVSVSVPINAGPVATNCNMESALGYNCLYCGLTNVQFATINNQSPNTDSYEDFTCIQQTSVYSGQTYPCTLTSNGTNIQYHNIYIDFNNDGVFAGPELIVNNLSGITQFNTNINIPSTAVTNMPLRMRVGASLLQVNPCDSVLYGQMEDYTITVLNGPTEVESFVLPKSISVYPNPFNDHIIIHCNQFLKEPSSLIVQLFDFSGKEIIDKEIRNSGKAEYEFVVPTQLAKGNYMVQVIVNGQVFHAKLSK